MTFPSKPQPPSRSSPTKDTPRRSTPPAFAFDISLLLETQPSQDAREPRLDRRPTTSRGRPLAPPPTATSLSSSSFPVTPPGELALEDLGHVRGFPGAAAGAIDIAPNAVLTVPRVASPLLPTTHSPASPFPPLSRPATPGTRGEFPCPLSRCSSKGAYVGPDLKNVEALAVENDFTIKSARYVFRHVI